MIPTRVARHGPKNHDYPLLGERRRHSPQRFWNRFCRVSVIIPLLLILTLLIVSFMIMAESTPSESHLTFSCMTGYFQQDDEATDPAQFDYVSSNFGLIPRSYDSDAEFDPDGTKTQWERFENEVTRLNHEAPPGTGYKVLFLGRHGEGFHNVAEQRYGTKLWDCYWSLLDGDENGTWVDAHLTSLGEAQAKTAHDAWEAQIQQKIPAPQSYYVSPLNRCLATASITFTGLRLPGIQPFQPVIKELLRETIGLHTCDKRSPKSSIATLYPAYIFEPNFSEPDPLYDSNVRESNSARDVRLLSLLRDIFVHDANTFLSLTAHSGAIESILSVTGHRKFALATGGVIPVFVRKVEVQGPEPVREVEPPTGAPKCT